MGDADTKCELRCKQDGYLDRLGKGGVQTRWLCMIGGGGGAGAGGCKTFSSFDPAVLDVLSGSGILKINGSRYLSGILKSFAWWSGKYNGNGKNTGSKKHLNNNSLRA